MDTRARLYHERSKNEFYAAKAMFNLSDDDKAKVNLGIPREETFYSAAIGHSYYAIFYSAKAILLSIGIKTYSPEIHRKTFDAFKKHFVDTGRLDVELLKIYRQSIVRAEELLGIYGLEKRKRGNFVYKTIPQANVEPATESMGNSRKFVSNIAKVMGIEV